MICLHCHATTTNGLALCDQSRLFASTILEMLPVYFRNLSRQRRPARPNGSLGSSGQWLMRRGESDGSKIAPALDHAGNYLANAARELADDRGLELPEVGDTEAEQTAVLCAWLNEHLTSIATLDTCGDFVDAIDKHERALRALTESVVPGWYAGTCRQVTGRNLEGDVFTCGTDTFVVPGLTWVTCGGCGATTYARDHLEVILEEARGWVAPPMRLAEAIVALVDAEQSTTRLHKRIAKWGERGQVATVRKIDGDGDAVGPKRHQLGEVLDLLAREGATRLDAASATKAS